MLRALALSLRQLSDRAILAVLAKSLAVTMAIVALIGVGYWFALDAALAGISARADPHGWLTAIAVMLAAITGWLFFRVIAIAVLGVFADDVVAAVERRHYPTAMKTARPVGIGRSARMGLVSGARALAVNAAIVPLYLILLATGVGAPLLFLVANGWLLGRDLGDMVAVRHLAAAELPGWRRSTAIPRFVLGLGVAALMLVPVVALLAPVLGAALATHLFHRRPA